MIFVGNVVLEIMGFKIFGFGGGCVDVWELEEDIYWGLEIEWLVILDQVNSCYLGDCDLENLLVVVQMGLIYVNLEGLDGNLDFLVLVCDICEIFGWMVMNDEEIVVLVVGGYIFGKVYGNGDVVYVGVELEGVLIEVQGFGWLLIYGLGKGVDMIILGIEGFWIVNLIQWDMGYFDVLFGYEWELIKLFVGVYIWYFVDVVDEYMVFEVDGFGKKVLVMMIIVDMVMCMDLIYGEILCCFYENLDQFVDVFVCVWFKLIYCDMGLKVFYKGLEVLVEELIWMDLILVNFVVFSDVDVQMLKDKILLLGLLVLELVSIVWVLVLIFCGLDLCGGVNGVCVCFVFQKDWEVNQFE